MRNVCGCRHFRDSASSFLVRARHFPPKLDLMMYLIDVLDESCDGDAEDELDNPGTTIGTKFSVLHKMFFFCLVHRGCLPLTRS